MREEEIVGSRYLPMGAPHPARRHAERNLPYAELVADQFIRRNDPGKLIRQFLDIKASGALALNRRLRKLS